MGRSVFGVLIYFVTDMLTIRYCLFTAYCITSIQNAMSFPFCYLSDSHYEKFTDSSVKCIKNGIPFDMPEGWALVRLSVGAE